MGSNFDKLLAAARAGTSGASVTQVVQETFVPINTSSLAGSLPEGLGKPGSGTTSAVPLSGIERLSSKIEDLQAQLQANAPGYAGLLHEIHTALMQDESLVHMLSEEKIGVIIAGLSKRKAIVIAEAVTKKSTSKQLSKLGADDF